MNYSNEQSAREIICEIGRRAYQKGFVAANDGNFSVRIGDNLVVATPTGVSKGFMTPEILVTLDLDGNVVQKGELALTSEIKMHLRVYKENAQVGAVIHTHSPLATAYGAAGISLDDALLLENVVFLGVVPCTAFALAGSDEVPEMVAPYCKDYNAVLLGNHGVLTWGANAMEAYYRTETLEHYAKIHMVTRYVLGSNKTLTKEERDRLLEIRQKAGIERGGIPWVTGER